MNMDVWAMRGTQVYREKKGRATEKLNIITGMTNGKIVAPLSYNYNTDSFFFNIWLDPHLIPELPEYSVFVMDNAIFHNTKKTKDSPDFNPIEKFWASLKAKIKNIIYDYNNLCDCVVEVFKTI